jgi:hypothetical protein
VVTLIAEDLLLLLLDDEKGTLTGSAYPQAALGGAVLTELALTGAVTVGEKTGVWHSAKVLATPGAEPGDAVLRAAYDVVAERPRSAQDLVTRIGKGLREQLAERLVARGVLERQESRALGLIPRTRWPALDMQREDEVRRRLTAALVQGAQPEERTAALIALLAALDKAHKVVDHEGLPAKDVRRRAREIAEGAWAATAVRDAINASIAAVTAAVGAAAATGAVTGS